MDSKLRTMVHNLAETRGSGFLACLVTSLAQAAGADYVCVASFNKDRTEATTEIAVLDGKVADNTTYSLKNTPGERLAQNGKCLYKKNVQAAFPEDSWLARQGIQGCIGKTLCDADGKPVGLAVALFRKPIAKVDEIESLFSPVCQLIDGELKRRQIEKRLQLSNAIIENAIEGIMICNANTEILYVNKAFETITGFSSEAVLGKRPQVLNSGYHEKPFFDTLWKMINDTGHWYGEIWNRRKSGEVYPEWLSINTLRNGDGKLTHYVGTFFDISERKAAEQKVRFQANFDSLTKLANRQLFLDRLNQAIHNAERHKSLFAVFFLDLDMFKEINDSLGHQAGDQLLIKMAKRIQDAVRDTDTAARLGGDEFTVIINDIASPKEAEIVASTLLDAVRQPFLLDEHKLEITTSLGIALYPSDSKSPERLLEYADQAMYYAKHHGKNRFSFFTRSMQEDAERRMKLKQDLQTAMVKKEFCLVYLPVINLTTGRVDKFEALLRWKRNGELIEPDNFISVAEEFGLIVNIDKQVLAMVCKTLQRLRKKGYKTLQISINRSVQDFPRQEEKAPPWLSLLDEHKVPAAAICLEIGEVILAPEQNAQQTFLLSLKDAGAGIAIDDFGTGYSSLSSLRRFPIDAVKIDRRFIRHLEEKGDDFVLVSSIIAMAKAMHIKVIAVGVETEGQLKILSELGCDSAQGYYFCKPLTASQLPEYLDNYCAFST